MSRRAQAKPDVQGRALKISSTRPPQGLPVAHPKLPNRRGQTVGGQRGESGAVTAADSGARVLEEE